MKKVAIISLMNGSPWGGSEELWYKNAQKWLSEGQELMICVFQWEKLPANLLLLLQAGARIHFWGKKRRNNSFLLNAARHRYRMYVKEGVGPFQEVLDFGPDHVLVNQGATYDFLGKRSFLEFLKELKSPYTLLCHQNDEHRVLSDSDRMQAREVFKKAAKVIFVSHRNKEVASRQMALDLSHAEIVRETLSIDDTSYIPLPAVDEGVQFVCVGRLDCAYKGQDILLQALAGNKWKERNWQMTFYGNGPDQAYLEELIHLYHLQKKVKFGGYKDIRSILAEAHMLILPSLKEGTPISLMEAMICGRPAVVTDVGGSAEVVEEGISGFVAEAPQAKYVATALERAWESRQKWQDMGLSAVKAMERLRAAQLLELTNVF